MVQARILDEFKGASALLVWGEVAEMPAVRNALTRLVNGQSETVIGQGANCLTICATARTMGCSRVGSECGFLRWECSVETLRQAIELLDPLLLDTGHRYMDAAGEADEVIISAGEYPVGFGS